MRHKICTEKFHTPSLRKNNVCFQQKGKRWFDMRKTEVVSGSDKVKITHFDQRNSLTGSLLPV